MKVLKSKKDDQQIKNKKRFHLNFKLQEVYFLMVYLVIFIIICFRSAWHLYLVLFLWLTFQNLKFVNPDFTDEDQC